MGVESRMAQNPRCRPAGEGEHNHQACCPVSCQLLGLWRGIQSVTEFSINFHIKAAETGWEDSALHSAFVNGLCQSMKEELNTCNEPDGFKDLAIRIDNPLR